jgi:HEAT repeat protein
VLETSQDAHTLWRAVQVLGRIDPGNPKAREALIKLLETTTPNDYTRWQVALIQEQFDPGNPKAIAALIKILETTQNEDILLSAAPQEWQ